MDSEPKKVWEARYVYYYKKKKAKIALMHDILKQKRRLDHMNNNKLEMTTPNIILEPLVKGVTFATSR